MRRNSQSLRKSVAIIEILVVVFVLVASVLLVCNKHCRDELLHLVVDAVAIAILCGASQLIVVVRYKSRRVSRALRLVMLHHVRYALLGALLYALLLMVLRGLLG